MHDLSPQDVTVECLIGAPSETSDFIVHSSHMLSYGDTRGDETFYRLDLSPPLSGLQYYKIRLFPSHTLLSHRFETGCMIWL